MDEEPSAEDSSSTDSDDAQAEPDGAPSGRNKRDMHWCKPATDQKNSNSQIHPSVTWPPDPSARGSYTWRNLRRVKPGNPIFGTRMQLFSRTNYNLGVFADGGVRGTRDDDDLHTHLELINAGHPGHLRIQGCLTKLYVAMDCKGRLYGEPDVSEEGTVFIESLRGSYSVYLSRKFAHLGWYVGIKRSGRIKPGPKTKLNQKAIMFLPRRSKFE